MLHARFTTRGDHGMFRDRFHAFGNIPRSDSAVPRLHGPFRTLSLSACLGHSREAMRLVSLILLAAAAFGQTYTASTLAGVWLPENLPGASVSLNQIGGVAGMPPAMFSCRCPCTRQSCGSTPPPGF